MVTFEDYIRWIRQEEERLSRIENALMTQTAAEMLRGTTTIQEVAPDTFIEITEVEGLKNG